MPHQFQKSLFCFGYGYSAQHLAVLAKENAFQISGTYSQNRKENIPSYLFNEGYHLENASEILKDVTHILISIPPQQDCETDIVLQAHLEDLLQLENLEWVGLLSTTGVYGHHDNEWVDETSETKPSDPRTEKRLQIEKDWLEHKHQLPIHIFRLGGIYGTGRNLLSRILHQTYQPVDDRGHYFSRIHVEDIAGILWESIQEPAPGEIYNLVDDHPAPQYELAQYAYELLGRELPDFKKFEEASFSPMMKSFYSDKKRVSNQKVKERFGYQFKYPTYKEGLKAIHKSL